MLFAQKGKLPVIDMHVNAYDEQHYFVSKDVFGLKSPTTDEGHFNATYQMMEDYNVVKGVVANESNAINKWRSADDENKIIWGTGMVFPKLTDINSFEKKARNGEIDIFGEMPPLYHKYSVNQPDFAPYMEICEKYDIPVAIHLGTEPMKARYNSTKDSRLTETTVGLLAGVLKKYPDLRIHLLHTGEVYNYYEELINLLAKNDNVYVSMGGVMWLHPTVKTYSTEFLLLAKEKQVLNQVMFGSNQGYFPHGIKFSINYINSLKFLTKEEKQDIFYNNAAKFLRLKDNVFMAGNF